MTELLWIAVPNGRHPTAGGKALVRVLMVPRLTTDKPKEEIKKAGLKDWPALLLSDEVGFSMYTRTASGTEERKAGGQITLDKTPLRSDAWAGFFSGAARFFRSHTPKPYAAPKVSEQYTNAGNAVKGFRQVTYEVAKPGANLADEVSKVLQEWKSVAGPITPPPDPATPTFPDMDFHATVSILREHPSVLLALGLVFELTVDVADLVRGGATCNGRLSVRCTAPDGFANDTTGVDGIVRSPWTRYDVSAKEFRPAPSPNESGIMGGMLDLSKAKDLSFGTPPPPDAPWAITTVDVDGVVDGLRRSAQRGDTVMPPIRSVGLVLLRNKRQADFDARINAGLARARSAFADMVFGAEDLILGYRVDIMRKNPPWLSVCARNARYTVGQNPNVVLQLLEEGHVKPYSALKDAGGALYADATVLCWNGWSLAVRQDNLRGDSNGPADNPNAPRRPPYKFSFAFDVPNGSLPQLRFSEIYSMRVRIADLAGGGLRVGQVNDNDATIVKDITYLRHDPVQPPTLSATTAFPPGATLEELVIHSDWGITTAQLAAQDAAYTVTDRRALDPPTASLQMIEQHGKLDGLNNEQSFDLASQAMAAEANGSGLADPITDGMRAFIRYEGPHGPVTIEKRAGWFVPKWPTYRTKAIEISEISGTEVTADWVPDSPAPNVTQTLKIGLPQAKQATIDLSSTIDTTLQEQVAMYGYFDSSNEDDRRNRAGTVLGRNPIVSPPRRLRVVHAVRKPLSDPIWKPLVVERAEGDTSALLKASFTGAGASLNTDSIGRLDVSSTWTEINDIGATATDTPTKPTIEHLHSQAIALGAAPEMRFRHEFGDTKYRRITYTLNAASRFRAYFKPSDTQDKFERKKTQDPPVDMLSTARPSVPVVLGVVPAFRWERTATTNRIEHNRRSRRLRVELARPWYQTGIGEQLAVILATSNTSPAAKSNLVTRIGRDPLFGTPPTPLFPTRDWFPADAQAQAREVNLPEMNTPVLVVPVAARPAGDRWYADIDFIDPTIGFYNPLVRLAVARYQLQSLPGLSTSPVVVTDTVPLLPDRRVVIARSGNNITVSVSGTSPNPPNRLEAILETCPASIADPEIFDVVDESGGEPTIAAWRPLARADNDDGDIEPIPLPTVSQAPGRLRVRVRETERRIDAQTAGTAAPPDLLRRNVFIDAIVLPPNWRPA